MKRSNRRPDSHKRTICWVFWSCSRALKSLKALNNTRYRATVYKRRTITLPSTYFLLSYFNELIINRSPVSICMYTTDKELYYIKLLEWFTPIFLLKPIAKSPTLKKGMVCSFWLYRLHLYLKILDVPQYYISIPILHLYLKITSVSLDYCFR